MRAMKRTSSDTKYHWFDAVEKAKVAQDPWEEFNIEKENTERAIRFRYNALQKKWVQDNVLVKMQKESFGKGAMRKCFRMKKLSSFVHQNDWSHATNIVAKSYIEEVLPKVYFDDVKLQMDAKLWAEEYNRHDPPKKVDIIQVGCIKLIDRENAPMYHIEHFVEGEYVKYNSNSGFVLNQDKSMRDTPQAFSHFTFERSGHQMIVVDIQGVGDLYTDPQIHTAKGCEYGEANLGTKGMALFFASHRCLNICHELDLIPFDLSNLEDERILSLSSKSSTTTEVRPHSLSNGHKIEPRFDLVERIQSLDSDKSLSPLNSPSDDVFEYLPVRRRMYSEVDSGISSEDENCSHENYFNAHERKGSCVPSCEKLTDDCIQKRLKALTEYEEQQYSILGQIHYDLAVYNYVGRFTDNMPDYQSVVYHLEKAAETGSLEANKILAFKHFQLSTNEFEELIIEENLDRGMDYLLEAATRGDRECAVKTAKAFEKGENLGSSREKSWKEALRWYEAILNMNEADKDFSSDPVYQINATMAEIWRAGGYGVEKDPSYAGELYTSAAEAAMASGKGKLANKYYMLAEEAWGEVEED